MSSNYHIEGQTTKKYDLPLTHLEYSYIEKCTSVKELEKILRVLRSGDEGKFPDLERFAEKRLEDLDPKSRVLRKDGPILRPGDLSSGDWQNIEDDLKTWTNSMHDKVSPKAVKTTKTSDDIVEVDENLPPIRSTNVVLEGKKQKKPAEKAKKRVLPRDYKEWDKVDIDAELEKMDNKEEKAQNSLGKSKLNGVSLDIDTTGMSEEEKEQKANREKDKGNEAFRSHDFEESVAYYTRSISLMSNAASYNNRALAYLKLEKWDKAIKDCNKVLSLEKDNIKALLRRGTAYKSKQVYKEAVTDFEKVLKMEPNNKKAEDLLAEVNKEIKKEEKARKEKGGRRMVIEEVDSDEETEEIEVEKQVVNGHGLHGGDKKEDPSTASADGCNRNQMSNTTKTQPTLKTESSPTGPVGSALSDGQQAPFTESQDRSKVTPLPVSAGGAEHNHSEPSQSPLDALSSQNTTSLCSNISQASTSPVLEDQSALSSAPQSDKALNDQSLEHSKDTPPPQVSFTLEETSQAAPQTTVPEVTSQPSLTRPMLVQLSLPPAVLKLKDAGNTLFRSGQYGDAVEQYSKAIVQIEKEADQKVNLSVLLSNRAACHLKTGNCSQAVSDCDRSLQYVPHGIKALLRRAAAYEAMERYGKAYVDYKHVISLDKSTDQAHQGATRCQSMLQRTYGTKTWREKIPSLVMVQPWDVPLIVDEAGMHRSMSSTASIADQGAPNTQAAPATSSPKSSPLEDSVDTASSTPSSVPSSQPSSVLTQQEVMPPPSSSQSPKSHPESRQSEAAPVQISKEQEFEQVKAEGNQFVQKGQYQEALKCYSMCISLCPDQIACYTNRALCYLKLSMASEAEADCDKALSLQKNNPKALYRRALARKMLKKYKLSLQDLVELLKLEPKNTAAQKEMDAVKKIYKEELDMLKLKKATAEQEAKVRKRMKIEEVDDEDDEEKPSRGKTQEKVKSQSKQRGGKSSQPSPGNKTKSSISSKKQSQAHESSTQGQPVAPPIAPRLMKTTPYEFCQAWNSLKPCQGIQPYAEILRQVSPIDLPTVISNKLDGQMLQIIVRCVYEEMVLKGEIDLGYQILDNLCQVPRFSTVSMFMSGKEKKEVSGVLDILSKTTSSAYTTADIVRLKKEYSVK